MFLFKYDILPGSFHYSIHKFLKILYVIIFEFILAHIELIGRDDTVPRAFECLNVKNIILHFNSFVFGKSSIISIGNFKYHISFNFQRERVFHSNFPVFLTDQKIFDEIFQRVSECDYIMIRNFGV